MSRVFLNVNVELVKSCKDNQMLCPLITSLPEIQEPDTFLLTRHPTLPLNNDFFLNLWTGRRRVVAAACLSTTSDRDISESEVRATATPAKNVVIHARRSGSSLNVVKHQFRDGDTISWISCGSSIEVILLHVDTVGGDAGQHNVLVCDSSDLSTSSATHFSKLPQKETYCSSGARVGLDSASILTVRDCRV